MPYLGSNIFQEREHARQCVKVGSLGDGLLREWAP